MTPREFVDRLVSLPGPVWRANPGRSDPKLLAKVDALADGNLPEDWREIYSRYDGGSVHGRTTKALNLMLLEDILELSSQESVAEGLPGMVGIGTDGGGALYYLDAKNQLGHGENAVYWIQLGVLTIDASRLVAPSLREAIDRVLRGDDVAESPTVRELRATP
jgi:hypothetical protein